MNLRSDKRQNIQGELDFSSPPAGEAREARREETESPSAMHDPGSPARTNRLMEEICERENLKQALQQVKANKGSAGVDGHSIDARATFISLHLLQSLLQVFSLTYFLHQSVRAGWASGVMHRRGRFGLFPSCFAGFTRWRRREVQFSLDVLPLVAPEIHVLLASPSRSGLRPPFPARPICFSTFRIGVPH